MRPSLPTAMPCTPLNWPGPLPRVPNDDTNLPFLSNFAMRALRRPSATRIDPSGRNARSCGMPKCVASSPATPVSPIVITSCLPSFVNLWMTCLPSLTTHTCFCGIVRTDPDLVRRAAAFEQLVPLRPRLDHLAGAIDDDQAVADLGRRLGGALPRRSPRPVEAARRRTRRLDLAAHADEDAIGRLRKHRGLRAPDVSGRRPRLRPVRDDFVGAGLVFAAFLLRKRQTLAKSSESAATRTQSSSHRRVSLSRRSAEARMVGPTII